MDYFNNFDEACGYFYNCGLLDILIPYDARAYYWQCNDSERAELDAMYDEGVIDSMS